MGRPRRIYQTGVKYGKVGVILLSQINMPDNRPTRGVFECTCSNIFEARIDRVVANSILGCGCRLHINRKEEDKVSKHPLYNTYILIKTRCYNPNNVKYKWYGARGIRMSDEFFNSFEVFRDYVISLPNYDRRIEDNLTLDRIENNSHYERGNLRWVTSTVQNNNKRAYGTTSSTIQILEILDE